MAIEISQNQQAAGVMRQDQSMTQHQIRALELLFAPVVELQTIVNQEVEKNPTLETDCEERENEIQDADEWLDKIVQLEEESRYVRSFTSYVSPEEAERRQHYLESIVAEKSLQERLIDQLKFLGLDNRLRECCDVIISGLNDDGYLTSHPADLAMASGESMTLVTQAINTVQQLEPAGVAAADLRERLLLQLDRRGRQDSMTYTAVRDHLQDIAANHLPAVARKMHISLDHLKELVEEIRNLNPRLEGGEVSPGEYVSEEVSIVTDDTGKLQVQMNNDHLPSLYISRQYRQLLADPATSKDVRDYIKDKVRSGVFMINSIIQRQTTIRKIAGAIVREQEEFFLHGMDYLKPMTMAQIAREVGVHETTVSRAVSGKYLRCRYGLLPLRQFFSTGYIVEDGRTMSNAVVKSMIKQMIEAEDATKPLSDSRLAKQLNEQGVTCVRRTVAKYREAMGILASNLRRQY